MELRIVAAVSAVVLLAGTAAAASVEGEVRFPEGYALDGDVAFRAREGAIDLGSAAAAGAPFEIRWTGATVDLVHLSNDYYHSGAIGVWGRDPVTTHQGLALREGSLSHVTCTSVCRALVVASGAGEVGLAGEVRSASLEYATTPHVYWSGSSTGHRPDSFHYDVDPDWIQAGAGARGDGQATTLDAMRPSASGQLTIYLWNVSALLVDAQAREHITTGLAETPISGPAGTQIGTRYEITFAVLDVTGASLVASGTDVPALFMARAPFVDVRGEMSAPDASGVLTVDGAQHEFDEGDFRLVGELAMATGHDNAHARSPGALAEPTTWADVTGSATLVVIGGARVATPAPLDPALAWGSIAAVLAAGLLALLKLAGWLPSFTRLTPASLLENPNRRAVFDMIRTTPGSTIVEIHQFTGLNEMVVRHHLRMLESHRFVKCHALGRRRAYATVDDSGGSEHIVARVALSDDTRRKIASFLAVQSGMVSQKEISLATGVSQRLVSYHVARLRGEGLLDAEGTMPRRYAATARLRGLLCAS